MSLKSVYEEILFLLPDAPVTLLEKSIIFIHAINTKEGFKNNGVSDDDPDVAWVGIAEKWNKPIDGI